MQFKIITIPFEPEQGLFFEDALNDFCINKRIIKRKVEFFSFAGHPYWSVFLEYEAIATAHEFTPETTEFTGEAKILYDRLREWRRLKAQALGLPVYFIFTNKQLEALIGESPQNLESLKRIAGFGRKKIEKFGKEIVDIIVKFDNKSAELRVETQGHGVEMDE